MKCIIVDDEAMAIKVLKNHIDQISSLEIVATHQSPLDAFASLQKHPVDLLFLDIQMPRLSGFDLLKTLPSPPQVIITTAHREYALESYDFTVTDYLLKPISFERFLKALGKVQRPVPSLQPLLETTEPSPLPTSFFYIRSNRQFIKIHLDQVLYIESLRNHVRIITTEGNHTTLTSISEMEEKLPPQHFLRIHRSYIVALSKIDQFSQASVVIGEWTLPIGSFYKKGVMERIKGRVF